MIFTFKIKIIKTKQKCIIIGVVDELKQRNQRSSCHSPYAICYYGYNGNKLPSTLQEGNGFSQG
jgi:hypothetical protein